MNIKPNGEGTVLPPGSAPAADTLPESYRVTIDGFDDSGMIRCVYPGGFVKHHQAGTVEELAGKVLNQLRGRYGVAEVAFKTVPKALKPGQAFAVEV